MASSWNPSQLFSSERDDYETPEWLFAPLQEEFGIDLDTAASAKNSKCRLFFSSGALEKDWSRGGKTTAAWCNPPYSRNLYPWIKKMYEEGKKVPVVALVFARTCTKWWHDFAMKADEIRFVKKRVKFELDGKEMGPATAPSCILVFTPGTQPAAPLVKTIGHPSDDKKEEARKQKKDRIFGRLGTSKLGRARRKS